LRVFKEPKHDRGNRPNSPLARGPVAAIQLIHQRPIPNREFWPMKTDDSSPEIIASRLTEQEATILVEYLREQGIDAQPWGTHIAGIFGEGVPRECMQVVVRTSDADSARRALETFRSSLHSRAPVVTLRSSH
jgi:hypothetical protein